MDLHCNPAVLALQRHTLRDVTSMQSDQAERYAAGMLRLVQGMARTVPGQNRSKSSLLSYRSCELAECHNCLQIAAPPGA